jgi:hypothetical protein
MGKLRVSRLVFEVGCKDAGNPGPRKIKRRISMKRFGIGLLALAFTVSAYAAQNSKTVTFDQVVQVGSTKLATGPVKVSWTGTGSDAQVTFAVKGSTPVTVPAQIIDKKNAEPSVATIAINGVNYLQEVDLDHVTVVLKNAPTSATQAGN